MSDTLIDFENDARELRLKLDVSSSDQERLACVISFRDKWKPWLLKELETVLGTVYELWPDFSTLQTYIKNMDNKIKELGG